MLLDIIVKSLVEHSHVAWLLGYGVTVTETSDDSSESSIDHSILSDLKSTPSHDMSQAQSLMQTLLHNLNMNSVSSEPSISPCNLLSAVSFFFISFAYILNLHLKNLILYFHF